MIFPQKKKHQLFGESHLRYVQVGHPGKSKRSASKAAVRFGLNRSEQKKQQPNGCYDLCEDDIFNKHSTNFVTPPSEATPDDSRLPVGGGSPPSPPGNLALQHCISHRASPPFTPPAFYSPSALIFPPQPQQFTSKGLRSSWTIKAA